MYRSIATTAALSMVIAPGCNQVFGLDPVSSPDSGNGSDGRLDAGPAVGPTLVSPMQSQSVSPRAYFYVHDGLHPSGPVDGNFQFCLTSGSENTISGEGQCPGVQMPGRNSSFSELSLSPPVNYLWKAHDGNSLSPWSVLGMFSAGPPPVAWYKMQNNAQDSGPDGIHLEERGGLGFGGGVVGQTAICDGQDDYAVTFNSVFHVAGALSLGALVNIGALPASGDAGIVTIGDYSIALTYGRDAVNNNGKVTFSIGSSGNSVTAPLSPGGWHHVVGVFDGTTSVESLKLYIDGQEAASGRSVQATAGANGSFMICRVGTNGYLNGRVDDVLMFSYALSPEGVLNMYCAAIASGITASTTVLPLVCTP